jgi:hypothetical protein
VAKQRKHTFSITVRFDKKCTVALAHREIRDCIYGDFYTTPRDDSEPDTFRITSIGRVKEKRP